MNSTGFDVQFLIDNPLILSIAIALAVSTFVLKGFALWKAARNNSKGWFVVLMILNTAGILEILYLIFGGKKRS